MKKIALLILLGAYVSATYAEKYMLDTIKSVIYTTEGTQLITHSEMMLPSLQGGSRGLEDMVFEALVYFDAQKHKIEPNEDAVDRYLIKLMKENNLIK